MRDRRPALLAFVLFGAMSACRGAGHDPVYIGAAGHLDGNEAARENARGIALAVDEANAHGGINGRPIKLVTRNDSGNGELAARAARAFVADQRISIVVGHTTSTAMLAAAPVYDGRLAAIATTASAPALTGISRWVFRVVPSDSTTGAQLARFVTARGWRTAAILYQNDVYGRGLADAFRANYTGTLLSSDPIAIDDTAFRVFGRYYERFRPDVVFVVAGRSTVPVQLRAELARLKLHVAILASEGSTDLERDAGRADEIFVSAPFSWLDAREGTNRFVHAYVASFGHPPKHDAALAYDAAITAIDALRAVGTNRAAVRRYLSALDSVHAPIGATGRVYFDPTGDRHGGHGVLLEVNAGTTTVVGGALH